MASEFVARLNGLRREIDLPNRSFDRMQCPAGDLDGYWLPKIKVGSTAKLSGYVTSFVIPASLTMGTGLTLKLPITDDGTIATDVGKVVRLGVAVKTIVSNTDNSDLETSGGTEQTVDVTLGATSGIIVIGSLAVALANLDSAVVGSLVALRIRRVGDATQDTAVGGVILLDPYVLNT